MRKQAFIHGFALAGLTLVGAPALGQGRIVPSLPKDLRTTCRVTSQEGSGFSTYSTMHDGDTYVLDLRNPAIGREIRFNDGGIGNFYLPLSSPLRLEFSEFNGYVSGAIYRQETAEAQGEVQMFVELTEEGRTDRWIPIVTLQQRVVYGWKWLPPATAVLTCDARIQGQNG